MFTTPGCPQNSVEPPALAMSPTFPSKASPRDQRHEVLACREPPVARYRRVQPIDPGLAHS